MILRETLGLSADGSQKAYRHEDVEAFFKTAPFPLTYNPRRLQENQVRSQLISKNHALTRRLAAVRVLCLSRPVWRRTLCLLGVFHAGQQGESASGATARRSEPHMLYTTLVATTSRSGFCRKALT